MKQHSRNFPFGDYSSGFGNEYAGQYPPPETKRFRHDKWAGMSMSGDGFQQRAQNPYYGSNVGFPSQYHYGAPYRQHGGGGNFGQQRAEHSFGGCSDMSYAANWRPMFPASHSHAARQPFTSGYAQRSRQPKRGSLRIGNQSTNESPSNLKVVIQSTLLGRGSLQAKELSRELSCKKQDINRVLYQLQREGVVDKISELPPKWVLKGQLNAHNSGCSSQTSSCTEHRSSMPATCSYSDVSARSVVPLRVQAESDQPSSFSSTAESFDIIPAVAVRCNTVPDVLTFDYPSYASDLAKTAVNAGSTPLSSAESVDQVYHQNIAGPSVSLVSSACSVSRSLAQSCSDTFDVSRQKTVPGDSVLTVFGELKKPAGRGRGALLLNPTKDHMQADSVCSLPAKCEPCNDETLPDTERYADDSQFDSGILPDFKKQPTTSGGVGKSVAIDEVMNADTCEDSRSNSQLAVKSELTLQGEMLPTGRAVLSGTQVSRSSGTFKPPLPPKQLIRANPAYKAPVDYDTNSQLNDDRSLYQDRGAHFAVDTELESYKSLPDCLSTLSFQASSTVPRSRSLDDVTVAKMSGSNSSCPNPFAAALGMDDSVAVGTSSSSQMPEGAGGLSLTSESFAALNKNSVSALMEYSQSRHVDVEIKCIGSFGPPHRPVYVLTISY